MPQRKLIRPTYPENLRCIGSACEDTCCHGWSVPIDRVAYDKYQSLPPSPLRALIDANILLAPPGATSSDGFGPEVFAKIRMNESNACPMLTSERLCQIQSQCGESFLSRACATYPRIHLTVGGTHEQVLSLSCPEAVRVALFNRIVWKRFEPVNSADASGKDSSWTPPLYWPIRAAILELARNRAYPLWQRLLLLGTLCHRLDAFTQEPDRSVPEFLNDFSDAVISGRMRTAMNVQPFDPQAQLDAVLRLAGLMLHKSNVTARFVECIHAFTTGIGNGPGATLESLTDGFTTAHDRFFAPFFDRHPQILENYLINTILRGQFPFGWVGMKPGASASMAQEFAKLTAQFALMKGLLIGVAGFHAERFAAEHVFHTVQAASKHFDHHPEFPRLAHELLVESRLDGLQGAAILLRHAPPGQAEVGHLREREPLPVGTLTTESIQVVS